MKYLFLFVLSFLSLQSVAETVCSDCNEKVASDVHKVEIFLKDELVWSENISTANKRAFKTINSINFVMGLNLNPGKCPFLFVGSVSYGPMVTYKIEGNTLSVPNSEERLGVCINLGPSEDFKAPLFSDYNVVVKRF